MTRQVVSTVRIGTNWHWVSLIIMLLALGLVSLVGRNTGASGGVVFESGQRLPVYLRVAVLEWLLFGYVLLCVRRDGQRARTILDRQPCSFRRWLASALLGIVGAILWMGIGAAIMALLKPTPNELRAVQSFLPHNAAERAGFVVLTLTAGFCEEFIYRGYLQEKFRLWTGSVAVAIAMQAGLFALLHVTLPWKFAVSATAMALFLGAFVHWRKSLVPAMVLHAAVNLFGGLLASSALQRG